MIRSFLKLTFVACGVANGSAVAQELAMLELIDGYWQVSLLSTETGKSQPITRSAGDKTRLSWFPDGERLLVSAADARVFVVDLEGKELDVDLYPPGTLDAVISPDGQRLAYSISTSGSIDDNNIWVADLTGQQAEKLTAMARLQHEPVWSLQGDAIYFLSGDGGQTHDIWRLDLASRRSEQVTVGSLYHFDIAPAADGRLAVSSNRAGHYDLWLLNPDGSAEALTNDPPLDGRPAWHASGSRLAFESSRTGQMQVWQIDLATKELAQLSRAPEGARFPSWRPEPRQ